MSATTESPRRRARYAPIRTSTSDGSFFCGRFGDGDWYTYIHRRASDGAPFYVGKGSWDRAWKGGRSSHWQNVVAKHGLRVEIVSIFSSEAAAFADEVRLIAEARAAGVTLINRTAGGDGASGNKRSAATKALITAAAAAWRKTPDGKAWAERQAAGAARQMIELRGKIGAARDAHFSVPSNRAAVGDRMRRYYAEPANRAAHAERAKARMTHDEIVAMSRRRGGRPVLHVNTGVVYETQGHASRALGIGQPLISMVINGHRASTQGQRFRYV